MQSSGNKQGYAEVLRTRNGKKQVIFRVQPTSCNPQGDINGEKNQYLKFEKIIINE